MGSGAMEGTATENSVMESAAMESGITVLSLISPRSQLQEL